MLTRKTYSKLSGHFDEVISLSINKDNSILISGSLDKSARIWDLNTKICLHVLFHNSPVNSVDIRDCQEIILTTADDGGLYIWDFVGELIKKIDVCQRNCMKGKFFMDSDLVLTWAKEQNVMVWNWKEKVLERTLDKHEGNIVDAAVCPDGSHFAVCEEKLRIYIWNIYSWSIEKVIKINDTIMCLTYSFDGKYLAHTFGSGYYTTLWDLENTHQIKTIINYPNKMNCLAITNDLEVVIEGSDDKIICVTYFNDKIRPNVLVE
jgi:WD40 repeat protein